jgi:glycosyltransferase involved in cell wall biosynthesis
MGWLRKPIMAYLRKFHNQTLCTMVPTDALRRDLEARDFRSLKVVARGVDTRQFAPQHRSQDLRAQWSANSDDLVVMIVGRLAPEKNFSALTAAFEAIERVNPRARLVVVGEGPLRAELQSRCPKAVFAGQRTGADLAAHYASADLFLFPSLTETFGNVTTEAMASGLPVLAFDYAAAGQLIRSGENGLLAPFGDNEAYIRLAAELANADALRRVMGERARQTAGELGWDGVVARFEAVLVDVIQRGDAAARIGKWSDAVRLTT